MSNMLGVRREGVNKVAGALQKAAVVKGLSAAGLPFGEMDDDSQAAHVLMRRVDVVMHRARLAQHGA